MLGHNIYYNPEHRRKRCDICGGKLGGNLKFEDDFYCSCFVRISYEDWENIENRELSLK